MAPARLGAAIAEALVALDQDTVLVLDDANHAAGGAAEVLDALPACRRPGRASCWPGAAAPPSAA